MAGKEPDGLYGKATRYMLHLKPKFYFIKAVGQKH